MTLTEDEKADKSGRFLLARITSRSWKYRLSTGRWVEITEVLDRNPHYIWKFFYWDAQTGSNVPSRKDGEAHSFCAALAAAAQAVHHTYRNISERNWEK